MTRDYVSKLLRARGLFFVHPGVTKQADGKDQAEHMSERKLWQPTGDGLRVANQKSFWKISQIVDV